MFEGRFRLICIVSKNPTRHYYSFSCLLSFWNSRNKCCLILQTEPQRRGVRIDFHEFMNDIKKEPSKVIYMIHMKA